MEEDYKTDFESIPTNHLVSDHGYSASKESIKFANDEDVYNPCSKKKTK